MVYQVHTFLNITYHITSVFSAFPLLPKAPSTKTIGCFASLYYKLITCKIFLTQGKVYKKETDFILFMLPILIYITEEPLAILDDDKLLLHITH